MTVLKIEGMSKTFGGLQALTDVNIDVQEHEFFGIIGPNGAGKTTLFSVLAGQIPPTSGRIVFNGTDITGWPAHKIAANGLVRTFQLMRPFESMTVLENVAIASHSKIRSTSKARQHAKEVIERVHLDKYLTAMSGTLSTAGLKRLELARALAMEPEVLLLDEVLAGLVPAERAPIIDLLREIHASGITIMFVEHIMAAVMALSDRLLVMHEGQKLALGEPKQVIEDPTVIEAYLGEEYA
ncbi:ABC transporter ATP-binding protein [Brevibacterium linens]|uniref:ABC transporter ATP-binding protein n=1 Tax=Brevibacterium linens TaxID=1703 RepID=UPI003BF59411